MRTDIQRKSLLVEQLVCFRQRRSRILRGRSGAESPQQRDEEAAQTKKEQDKPERTMEKTQTSRRFKNRPSNRMMERMQ